MEKYTISTENKVDEKESLNDGSGSNEMTQGKVEDVENGTSNTNDIADDVQRCLSTPL